MNSGPAQVKRLFSRFNPCRTDHRLLNARKRHGDPDRVGPTGVDDEGDLLIVSLPGRDFNPTPGKMQIGSRQDRNVTGPGSDADLATRVRRNRFEPQPISSRFCVKQTTPPATYGFTSAVVTSSSVNLPRLTLP